MSISIEQHLLWSIKYLNELSHFDRTPDGRGSYDIINTQQRHQFQHGQEYGNNDPRLRKCHSHLIFNVRYELKVKLILQSKSASYVAGL